MRRAGEVGDGEYGSGVGEGHAVRGEDVERVPPAHALTFDSETCYNLALLARVGERAASGIV